MKTLSTYTLESINAADSCAYITCEHADGTTTRYKVAAVSPSEAEELEYMTSNDLAAYLRQNSGSICEVEHCDPIREAIEDDLCTLSDAAYKQLRGYYDAHRIDIDCLRDDIDHGYLTANDYRDRTYLHYLDDNESWLIDAKTGEMIDDDTQVSDITEGPRYYITMTIGTQVREALVYSTADADAGGYCDAPLRDFCFDSLEEARQRIAELRAYAAAWENTQFTLWSTAEQSPIE